MIRADISACCLIALCLAILPAGIHSRPTSAQELENSAAGLVDEYFDERFEAAPQATENLLSELKNKHQIDGMQPLESLLRASRASYPDISETIGGTTQHIVECDHVDYQSVFLLAVPEDYDPTNSTSLVVVGHGGNSSMSGARARSVAKSYLNAYAPTVIKEMGAIVVAPASERGWGQIGNSLILSTISDCQRMFNIDPDRIYVTGQSMGGHLSYRSALTLPDRWGAVSPQSGGYDFVAKGSIGNLINVPGYVTWGKQEPYGINRDNRTNAAWARENGLEWVFVEKNGGHSIYADELPKMANFFNDHPRNLYRDTVYFRQGGAMKFLKTWEIQGWPEHEIYHETRPLRWNLKHWLEVEPRPDHQGPLTVLARNLGDNRIAIHANQARQIRIYLHPKMLDFDQPLTVEINGTVVHQGKVQPDPVLMLELAREFDDRGRLFWARLDFDVETDAEVEFPKSE